MALNKEAPMQKIKQDQCKYQNLAVGSCSPALNPPQGQSCPEGNKGRGEIPNRPTKEDSSRAALSFLSLGDGSEGRERAGGLVCCRAGCFKF